MRLVASGLARRGAHVMYDSGSGERCMTVTGLGGLGTFSLSAEDDGYVEFEHVPQDGVPDPMKMADMATVLLTGNTGPFEYLGSAGTDSALKAIVGRELRARGIDAELAVYAYQDSFHVTAEVRAVSPRDGDDSAIFVDDAAGITWIRDYREECFAAHGEQEFPSCPERQKQVAGEVVSRIAFAASLL